VLIGTTRNGLFFLGVATILLLIDPDIGLVFVAGGILSLLVACVGAHHAARLTRRFRRNETALTSRLHRTLARAAAAERDPDGEGTTHKPAGRPADSKLSRIEGATTITIHLILAATTCAILVLAIHAGRVGSVSPGEVFIVLIYVTLMHNKTVSLGRLIVRLGRVVTSAERLAAVSTSKRRRGRPAGPTRDGAASPTLAPATTAASPGPDRPPTTVTNDDGAQALAVLDEP
jgi:ABC-type transport system involved in cytochrome bd biosynthesis fused ATPase/permease subunit